MREYAYKKEEKNERIIKQAYSMLLINIFDAPNYSYSNMISGLQSFMSIVSESQSLYEETLNCILNNAERKIAQKGVFIANYIMGLFPLLISARVSGKNLKFLKEKVLKYLIDEFNLNLITEVYRWTFLINDNASTVISVINDFTQELFDKKVDAICKEKEKEKFIANLNLCLRKHFVDISDTIRKKICLFIIDKIDTFSSFDTIRPFFQLFTEKDKNSIFVNVIDKIIQYDKAFTSPAISAHFLLKKDLLNGMKITDSAILYHTAIASLTESSYAFH